VIGWEVKSKVPMGSTKYLLALGQAIEDIMDKEILIDSGKGPKLQPGVNAGSPKPTTKVAVNQNNGPPQAENRPKTALRRPRKFGIPR
jgi:hypothetical protein